MLLIVISCHVGLVILLSAIPWIPEWQDGVYVCSWFIYSLIVVLMTLLIHKIWLYCKGTDPRRWPAVVLTMMTAVVFVFGLLFLAFIIGLSKQGWIFPPTFLYRDGNRYYYDYGWDEQEIHIKIRSGWLPILKDYK